MEDVHRQLLFIATELVKSQIVDASKTFYGSYPSHFINGF